MAMRTDILFYLLIITLFACKKGVVTEQETEKVVPEKQREVLQEASVTVVNVTPTTTLDATFWSGIQTMLQTNHVDVVFC